MVFGWYCAVFGARVVLLGDRFPGESDSSDVTVDYAARVVAGSLVFVTLVRSVSLLPVVVMSATDPTMIAPASSVRWVTGSDRTSQPRNTATVGFTYA